MTHIALVVPVVPEPLIHQCDVPGPRYTSYPPVPSWNPAVGPAQYEAALRAVPTGDEFALYAHFPFCAKRCLYCGCNAIASSRASKIDAYLDDFAQELSLVTAALGRGRPVCQMHWGGGTPNLLDAAQTECALRMLRDAFTFTADAELSVECDPRVVPAAPDDAERGCDARRYVRPRPIPTRDLRVRARPRAARPSARHPH